MMMAKLLILWAAILLLGLSSVGAQQPKKIPRLGVISGGSALTDAHYHQAFLQGLSELGYVKDKTVLIEDRYAEGNRTRFSEFASEMVGLRADVIVVGGATGVREAKNATSTIPIVMSNVSDPVELGFVKSLSRPGGNVTGLSTQAPELSGKRLELLKEIVPNLSRIAVLWQPGGPGSSLRAKETEAVARSLGIKTQMIEVKAPAELEGAFAEMKRRQAEALIPLRSPLIGNHADKIIELAAINRLPAIYDEREFIENGGLIFYGPDHNHLFRRAAVFVDKILKGAKPAELPVEQPTKFELIINLKTAKQIGLIIPPNVLARADRVIR
jgi:putative ABC transport system substrate-binding protein